MGRGKRSSTYTENLTPVHASRWGIGNRGRVRRRSRVGTRNTSTRRFILYQRKTPTASGEGSLGGVAPGTV